MANNGRQSERFSIEPDNTLRDIWQFSQEPDARFDPQTINNAVGYRKHLRKELGTDNRFSIGQLEGDSPAVREKELSRAMKRRSANVNLQKSIQMLDDAVATPGSLLRSARKTPAKLRHSNYTPQHVPSGSRFDTTNTLGLITPAKSMSMTPGLFRGTPGSSFIGEQSEMVGPDVVTSNVTQLIEEEPEFTNCNALYSEFMDIMRDSSAQHQVSGLLEHYQTLCAENVQLLKKLVKRAVPGQTRFVKTIDLMNLLNQERCTWRLVNSLYQDRLATEGKGEEEPMMVDSLGKRQSEKRLVDTLYERDSVVRQGQLVIDWLEKNSEDNLDDYYDRMEFSSDPRSTCENTLHQLKQKRAGNVVGSDRPMVDEMDPDAPVRQKKPLADLDVEDEQRLLKYLFALIRAGQLEEAQKLCCVFGEPWRAATLEGWRLYHDPNYDGYGPGGTVDKVQGNPYRDVWKCVCWRLADENLLSVHEKAMYAVFCGNLSQLLQACDSWQDYVWAYYRVMVDQRVENELRLTFSSHRPTKPLPNAYWEKVITPENVFQDIKACPVDHIKQESTMRYHVVQKFIILGDTDSLIEEMYEWTKDEVSKAPAHLLRFMAHIVLFFRTVGINTKEELCVAILEAYVKFLIEDKQHNLVATYVSTLPQEAQVEWYARFLEGIHDTEARRQCLALAGEVGLDIPSITKLVVENVRSRDRQEVSMEGDLPSEAATTEEDCVKIEALDWLVFDPEQRSEAMRQANAIIRSFLGVRKLAAAKDAFHKIPADSIDIIIKKWHAKTGGTDLAAEDDNAIREYLCAQSYLLAHDSFNDWFEHYHNAKPMKPEMAQGATFTERVAYEHKEKQYEAELERWKHSLALQSQTTEEKIYNVLLFVDGGWMVDQRNDGVRDDSRTHQMRLLRQLCLPTMCFLLHTVLHTTEQYRKCLQVSDIIASEQHQLYKTFRKDEMQKFLQKLRESAVLLLDNNMDPLGYDFS